MPALGCRDGSKLGVIDWRGFASVGRLASLAADFGQVGRVEVEQSCRAVVAADALDGVKVLDMDPADQVTAARARGHARRPGCGLAHPV